MASQYIQKKEEAIRLRKLGMSLREVEDTLHIPRSTLSYWFRDVELPAKHRRTLARKAGLALSKARIEAVKWHNAQKTERLRQAADAASQTLSRIDTADNTVAEIALAMLYLGEGTKKSDITAMGNSNPMVLKFFVSMLERLYRVPRTDMRCEIHIRADQKPDTVTKYWSDTLEISRRNFSKPSIDKRTAGKPTYPDYNGVCVVRCSRVAIQRKLMYIATQFCEKSRG